MEKSAFVKIVEVGGKACRLMNIRRLEEEGTVSIDRLPFAIRILVENLLRHLDGKKIRAQDVLRVARWTRDRAPSVEFPFHPARVLMQDFTGVPAVVDLAAMRDAVLALKGDPGRINPLVPVELIIDHSIQVDWYGSADAMAKNVEREYARNRERYCFLKWAQQSLAGFRVVPPNSGICHQVNLEHLSRVVVVEETAQGPVAFPDTLVGTDSHTTMINGVGVMGWGVGGIEAEAVMLGQPYYMTLPEVIGVRMTGSLGEGVNATDLVLTVTELLRKRGVVEKFVEFFGAGMKNLAVPDRATVANMCPEYGATVGFFPVDEKTVDYLRLTGRGDRAEMVGALSRELGLFYDGVRDPEYSEVIELDLSSVGPCLAGPARPQDRIPVEDIKARFDAVIGCRYKRDAEITHLSTFHDESGTQTEREPTCIPGRCEPVRLDLDGTAAQIADGSVVIAALTSCTNTSNPFVMMGAGLMAKKAVEKGLRVPPHVKTSLAPGSRVVIRYLEAAGLMPYLQTLGFSTVGFGCTTCIGNSGPLHRQIEEAVSREGLTVAAVLSGNRNFEARIHQRVKANFLSSPMLVIALALAGRIDTDLAREPLGFDSAGRPVLLREIWPADGEIRDLVSAHLKTDFFTEEYEGIFEGDETWRKLAVPEDRTFRWDADSTYIRKPPYFENFSLTPRPPGDMAGARVLLLLGDSVTTDHISPAGAIPPSYPAGTYLAGLGVAPDDFNSYGSRRGNHEVMMRGTFGNIRIKNHLVGAKEGSFTLKLPEKEEMYVFEAAMKYRQQGIPLVVLAGREYGTGSSRDWAAKGTVLLGVQAVIAESYERIHRSNLVGMGVLPLVFGEGKSWKSLGLTGSETIRIRGVSDMKPKKILQVEAVDETGRVVSFEAMARLDTEVEVEYFENGGILPCVLRKLLRA